MAYYENYCDTCDLYEDCEYAGNICFCDFCADRKDCTVKCVTCDAGHYIECNNGFEVEGNIYPEDEIEEDEFDEV